MSKNRGRVGPIARALLAVALLAAGLATAPRAAAAPLPSVRIVPPPGDQTLGRDAGDPVVLDPGVWIASAHGAFEVRVKRRTYDDPAHGAQVDARTHRILRRLASSDLDGWHGLADFLHVTVRDDAADVVLDTSLTFCPSAPVMKRLSTGGPSSPRYPQGCPGGSFTKGAVWGIDRGWAVDPFSSARTTFDGPDGHYAVTMSIEPAYAQLFGIGPRASSATVGIDVSTNPTGPSPSATAATRRTSRLRDVPTMTHPDPSVLPELASLPAWSITTSTDPATGHDLLDFAATEWNAGPEPLVVEAHRRPGAELMDAYQYFYAGGRPVGRARVGTMSYDADFGHNHWHFQQFAKYTLVDANAEPVMPSLKDGFCLAPTDAINMTAKGAQWRPYAIGFTSRCGDETSTSVREVLPVGWGDTYVQTIAGQSFDITDVPNGTYGIAIQVNPLHKLYERKASNDTQWRWFEILGTPGARDVVVPAWHGIDT